MKCPKCGESLPDGSRFCGNCGAMLTEETVPVSSNQEDRSDLAPEDAAVEAVVQPAQKTFVQPKVKKRKFKGIALIAVVAIAALIAVLMLKTTLLSKGSGNNAYVYLSSSGKYDLLKKLKSESSIEIASAKLDSDMNSLNSLVRFSKDGKYVYYYTKVGSSSRTGTLCRAEIGKLRANSSKNDRYIEVIASNVSIGMRLVGDEGVLYTNEDKTLYYYDGKETQQIAKSVNQYNALNNGQIVYSSGDYSDGYTLYATSTGNLSEKTKLASNYNSLYNFYNVKDFNSILYTKKDEDKTSLYMVGIGKDAVKLGSDIHIIYSGDYSGSDSLYFTDESGTRFSLYDLVSDEYASEDAGITEPKREDFQIPTYRYYQISDSSVKEADYSELYTSCTQELYWFNKPSWFYTSTYSMEAASSMDFGANPESTRKAVQQFIDKFGGKADDDGYILVTDEVKAALKQLNQYSEHPENDWQWLWLCCTRTQTGSTTDYAKYNEAYDRYAKVADRIKLRDALQDEDNEVVASKLYRFDGGVVTTVAENVLDVEMFGYALMYNTLDTLQDKPSITAVDSVYEVRNLLDLDYEAENYLVDYKSGKVFQMSQSAADTFSGVETGYYDIKLVFMGNSLFLNAPGEELYVAEISGGKAGSFSALTDSARLLRCDTDSNILYYAQDIYVAKDNSYCELYSYSNGKNTKLAQDVQLYGMTMYDDGVLLAATDSRTKGIELTMFSSGNKKTIIGDDITQYIRVDKSNVLLISDGDLYMFNGKEKKLLESDVEWIWCFSKMKQISLNDSLL